MFDIKENLKKLPDSPGVYIHKDSFGEIIYVGKAISLRKRVRQYFQSGSKHDPKVRSMVSQIAEFEYINTATEMEAFILECNLIKKHRPKYNILLRDDKTYPYIKVTLNEEWPRVVKTRIIKEDGGKYFGPYSDVNAVNHMVELLNNVYLLKKCKKQFFRAGDGACLNYHIGTCEGICIGRADKADYMKRVSLVLDFLKGKNNEFEEYLKEKMNRAAGEMNYEEAAKYRDRIAAIKSLKSTQRVVLSRRADIDMVLSVGNGDIVSFFVRDGKLMGRETYPLKMEGFHDKENEVREFIRLHYSTLTDGPAEILVAKDVPDVKILEEYLSDIWHKKVRIYAPSRGEKKSLMSLAKKDAEILKNTIDEKEQSRAERRERISREIAKVISEVTGDENVFEPRNLNPGKQYRLEAYDISNTNGVDTVGGMVVFNGLEKDKKSYRRFKIRGVDGQDDYAGMQEVIYRRFKRAQKDDEKFNRLPDVILIDGGKGHIAAVDKVLKALGINVCLLGMVKDDSHRTRALVYIKGDGFEEIPLKQRTLLFGYIGRIQEEVHRYAIDYHRGLRDKGQLRSVLDEIDGIGPVKRNSLLSYFESVENIRNASIFDLQKAYGITEKNAESVYEYFH